MLIMLLLIHVLPLFSLFDNIFFGGSLLTFQMLVNYFREGLMSYKQFIQELEDDVLPAEAERR